MSIPSFYSNLLKEFCTSLLGNDKYIGQVIEFGTATGDSTEQINILLQQTRKITTIDGFIGLPKTNKPLPQGANWEEGNINYDVSVATNRLEKYNNITIIKSLTSDLKHPNHYEISKVAGVNIDTDLYEGAFEGLKFIDKCDWKQIIVRFDDWGALPHLIEEEIAQHEQAAFYDFIKETKYDFKFLNNCNDGSPYHPQMLLEITR